MNDDEKREELARILRGFQLDADLDGPRRDLYEAARAHYSAQRGEDAFVSPRRFLAWLRHDRSNYDQTLDQVRALAVPEQTLQRVRLLLNCRLCRWLALEIDPHTAVDPAVPQPYSQVRALQLELGLLDALGVV